MLQRFENIYYIFLTGFIIVFFFLFNQENLYIIHHDTDLFYDIYNTLNQQNQHFSNPIWYLLGSNSKKILINFWIHYTFFIICYISITLTFIFNVIITPKITYSHWFIISFFFFMFKKIPIISNYSVFNCLIFFL